MHALAAVPIYKDMQLYYYNKDEPQDAKLGQWFSVYIGTEIKKNKKH